jgi:metal-sulfur cluster biosynthetic enzyme
VVAETVPQDDAELRVLEALETVSDPHVPASIVQMGMVRSVHVQQEVAHICISLPCISCPATRLMLQDIDDAVGVLAGIEAVDTKVTWERPWSTADLSPIAVEAMRSIGVQV